MTKFSLNIKNPTTWAKLRGAHTRLLPLLQQAVDKGAVIIAGDARELVSGKVLRVRTGHLRRSILPRKSNVRGMVVSAEIGSNMEYAPPHEYGFSGSVAVPAHSRTSKKGTRFDVRAHKRRLELPARSFLRRSADDNTEKFKHLLGSAFYEAFEI